MSVELLIVNVNAVIRDKNPRRRPVPFGIDELVYPGHGRESGRPRLYTILFRQKRRYVSRLNLNSISPRSRERVLQTDTERLRARSYRKNCRK